MAAALAAHKNVGALLQKRGYAELKKIGEGSFGKAILVQAKDGSKVVCKMVDISKVSAKDAKDAQKEGQVLSQLKHPYIVRYRDTFTEHGWFCILMDYCEGGDLIKQIEGAKKGRVVLGEEKILRWFTQALLALKYIHDRHILHRDLKPGNFFLSKTGVLKMGDFGIAKVLSCTAACARTQIGTPYYLSPEVCQEKPYSWGSDVWAMGCILYELCALRVPFDAPNMQALVNKIVQGPIPSVPNKWSPFVVQVCGQMLNRNAKQRPSVADILKRPQIQAVVKQMLDEANNDQAVIKGDPANAAAAAPPAGPHGGDGGAAGGLYRLGDNVDYFSSTHAQWMPAVILKVDEKGNVIIDLKPKQWMSRDEQRKRLRHARNKEPVAANNGYNSPAANVATPMKHRSPAPSPTPQAHPQSARYRSPSADAPRRPPQPSARGPSRSPSADALDRRQHGAGSACPSPVRGRSPSPSPVAGPSRGASPAPGIAASPRLRPPGIPKAADNSPLRRRNAAASVVGGAIAGAGGA